MILAEPEALRDAGVLTDELESAIAWPASMASFARAGFIQ